MKQSDFGVVAVLYAIIFGFLSMTLQLPEEAQTYPLTLLVALLFLNTLYLLQALLKYKAEKKVHMDLKRSFAEFMPLQFVFIAVSAALYIVCIEVLGYFAASILYLLVALLFLRVRVSYIVICMAALMTTIYFVFAMFLNVPLPVGMLFE